MPKFLALALTAALAFSQTGCIKSMLANGQIAATRNASGAFDTIADYELARNAASAGLVQFEGMHRLVPDNEDALFLLAKGWVGYGFAFPEDDFEAATLAENNSLADYHKGRAQMAYDRAIFYGKELVDRKHPGFDDAKKDLPGLKAWLDKNWTTAEDAEVLFWFAYAWLARVNIAKEDPEQVARLWIGVTMLEQAYKLDPAYMRYGAQSTLAAYHARSSMAEMDQSKAMFEDAIAKTNRKVLLTIVNYAARYACNKNDKALYVKLLTEAATAGDIDPTNRLTNAVAQRRAKRYLSKSWMLNECGWE